MREPISLQHHGEARTGLYRVLLDPWEIKGTCEWCGLRPGRFLYFWRGDDNLLPINLRPRLEPQFCSATCARNAGVI